ncbi:hypothetical protein GCM10009544_03490 [Streptomyces stramineus]|uniref:Uncharacterized protein n=1 Tax=Streptomyces stramineus TaxID=173861 RepID=A0ABN0ZD64_9ACTN
MYKATPPNGFIESLWPTRRTVAALLVLLLQTCAGTRRTGMWTGILFCGLPLAPARSLQTPGERLLTFMP